MRKVRSIKRIAVNNNKELIAFNKLVNILKKLNRDEQLKTLKLLFVHLNMSVSEKIGL